MRKLRSLARIITNVARRVLPNVKYLGRLECIDNYKLNRHSRKSIRDFHIVAHKVKQTLPLLYLRTFFSMFNPKMSEFSLHPPDNVRGMTNLDRNKFSVSINVPTLKVPLSDIRYLSKSLRKSTLNLHHIKKIADLPKGDVDENKCKLLLINPSKIIGGKYVFNEKEMEELNSSCINTVDIKYVDVNITYDNWTYSQIFDAVLPKESMGVSAFAIIGHIVHLNLKEDCLDYRQLIGEVIIDKVPGIRTVVNKVTSIDNTYRNFEMELLAGVPDYFTRATENGCSFDMDFSKVYWNPRLGTEHKRIVDQCPADAIIYDVFAGIGPFSIRAARDGIEVVANDLNPESVRWLRANATLNKVADRLSISNLDGREFIETVVKRDLESRLSDSEERERPVHIIMNLPGSAITFLEAFRNLLDPRRLTNMAAATFHPPTVHCYCFTPTDGNPSDDIAERICAALGSRPNDADYRNVRHVSPNKDIYCATFPLSPEILFACSTLTPNAEDDILQPESKMARIDVST